MVPLVSAMIFPDSPHIRHETAISGDSGSSCWTKSGERREPTGDDSERHDRQAAYWDFYSRYGSWVSASREGFFSDSPRTSHEVEPETNHEEDA